MSSTTDKYHRILLRKDKDAELVVWLEKDRIAGERPGRAIKRKLYELKDKDDKSRQNTKSKNE